MSTELHDQYIEFISKTIEKYKVAGNLLNHADELTPREINSALANYLPINLGLIAEYNRAKLLYENIKDDYQKWYDHNFTIARRKLQAGIEGAAKISLKEIEVEVRDFNDAEYYQWQEAIRISEYKMRFLLRIVDQFKKYDTILTTLSNNMRQEMRTLSLENRMNTKENVVNRNKVRRLSD